MIWPDMAVERLDGTFMTAFGREFGKLYLAVSCVFK